MSDAAFKTLQDWLVWQESLHSSEIDLGLERVQQVLSCLLPQCFQLPAAQFPFTVITVAGTNGKGSTVAMLEAVLSEAGYRVGCYTSPHLLHYNERIKINQTPVSEHIICDAFARIEQVREETSLTYFEYGTLAAIDIFYQQACEIVVLEVGLGGRLDAVNVIEPDIALITTVDLDHQDWLGNDRNSIGLEKAGIYRLDKPAIYGDTDVPQSIRDKVIRDGLSFYQFSKHYHYKLRGEQWDWVALEDNGQFQHHFNLPIPQLHGAVQVKNAANVLMVLELLKDRFPVSQSEIKRGLLNTALPGRFQIVATEPLIILDVAHNVQAAKNLKHALEHLSSPGKLNVIVGMLKDKDVTEVLSIIQPMVDSWRVIELNSPRGMPANTIAQLIREQVHENDSMVENIHCFDNFAQAYQDFKRYNMLSGNNEILLVFGSFFTVSDALSELNNPSPVTTYV